MEFTSLAKDMVDIRRLLLVVFLSPAIFLAQNSGSSVEKEESLQKTIPDKKLAKEDVQCGSYFWIAEKAGTTFLYYFFGSTEWGQGKMGYYQQSLYRRRTFGALFQAIPFVGKTVS